jgi:hypothetical protein
LCMRAVGTSCEEVTPPSSSSSTTCDMQRRCDQHHLHEIRSACARVHGYAIGVTNMDHTRSEMHAQTSMVTAVWFLFHLAAPLLCMAACRRRD